MSDEIFFEGVRYISAGSAGRLVGFTRDYVARLCKEGKLLGKRIGKQWYVNADSIQKFSLNQEYIRSKRSEELSQMRKQEYGAPAIHGGSDLLEHNTTPEQGAASVGTAVRSAVMAMPHHAHARAAQILSSAPLHAASLKSHASAQVLPPALELLHKFIAVTVAITFIAGTFLFVDAQYARIAERSSTELMRGAHEQFVAAAANPGEAFSAAIKNFARSFSAGVDSIVYSIMFPRTLVEDSRAKVMARVSLQSSNFGTQRNSSTSDSTPVQYVIERIIDTDYLLSTAGGITEEILDARLEELHDTLVARILFDRQTDATHDSIDNVYDSFAGSLTTQELTVSTSATIASLTLSSPLSISSGGTGTSSAPSYGQVLLGNAAGTYDLVATSSLGISGGGGSIDGSGSANLFAYWSDSDTLAATSSPTAGYFVATSSTTSIFPYASTTAFSVSGTGYFGTASTTNLTISSLPSSLLSTNGSGAVQAAGVGNGLTFSGNTLSTSFGTTTANIWTALQLFSAGASSTQFSSLDAIYVGRTATTTIQGNTTGTSTIQGFLNVAGTNSTSTFSGGLASTYLNITGTAATSTFANGIRLTGGCFLMADGTCAGAGGGGGVSLSAANTWTALQLFAAGASSTQFSALDAIYVGRTSTTTIRGDNVASNLPYASSTAISVSGTGYFGTASTTNLTISSLPSSLLSTNGSGAVQAAGVGNGLTFSGNTLSTSFGTTTANIWTALQLFSAGASSTQFSSLDAIYVGRTATTTIQGNTTGTSTIQGFLNVAGTNSTSTFSGGLASTYLNVTGTAASSTFANGINLANGCFAVNGTCVGGGSTPAGSGTEFQYRNGSSLGAVANSAFSAGGGYVSFGTTTSSFGVLTLGSSTAPQLLLSDNLGNNLWSLRSIGNTLYIATSTATATSTNAALFFNGSTGAATFGAAATSTFTGGIQSAYLNVTGTAATSTFANGINLAGGCFAVNGTCVGGNSVFTDGGATSYLTSLTDELAIGTTSAYAKLTVWGEGTGTGQLFELVNNASTTIAKFLDNGTGYFLGNIGIGTTSPYRKLSVTDAVTTAQAVLAYDGTRYTEFLTDSVGDLVINPQGDDAFLNDDNLWVCTGGSCPSNNPTGTGNLVVENKEGIGTTTPDSKLVIETQDATTDFLRIASSTAQSLLIFDERGFLGIGTSTPTQQFSIDKKLFVGNGQPSAIGTATSTIMGDLMITGKLDVSTIDPVYTIDGVKYATYGHSTVGIKEEAIAIVGVTQKSWLFGKYEYAIDFDELEEGSDLWLFYQVSDFGDEWTDLAVTATAGFDGTVSYKKNDKENTLTIISSAPGEVSLRLIADRFDADKWPNVRPDQGEGYPGFELQSKKEQ